MSNATHLNPSKQALEALTCGFRALITRVSVEVA